MSLVLEFHLSAPKQYFPPNTTSRIKTASPHMSNKQTKGLHYLTQMFIEKKIHKSSVLAIIKAATPGNYF